jgi:hypothetical protein
MYRSDEWGVTLAMHAESNVGLCKVAVTFLLFQPKLEWIDKFNESPLYKILLKTFVTRSSSCYMGKERRRDATITKRIFATLRFERAEKWCEVIRSQ